MKTLHSLLILFIAFACAAGLTTCEPVANRQSEVEISPGEWLRIEREDGRTWFRCQWKGKKVYWGGDYFKGQAGYYDRQLPVCLRSWQGTLYLIFQEYNYPDGQTTFKYCALSPDGTSFREIKRQDFPRQIATHNMGMNLEGTKHDENNKPIDSRKLLLTLDVTNPYFHNSITGWIWYNLETGLAPEEASPATVEEALAFYADFVKKYHPIALPTIERPQKD